jgi:SpoVK/Ycf46/Vps4 family AAA+-type ATPase
MIVLITSSPTMPETLSDLKPEIMPLPDTTALCDVAKDVLRPQNDRYEKHEGKRGIKMPEGAAMDRIIVALCGLTTQDAEEAMALAVVKHPRMPDLDAFIQTLEDSKAKTISNKPGLRYIPKSDIVGHCPPGYEALKSFIQQRQRISLAKARKNGITPIRGIALGGIPGVAKTEVAKYIARELGAIAILADFGGMKGSLVGESEKNMRVALQIGRAMHAVMIWDDVDKGSIGSAGGSYSGDGGTTGNMMSAILTDMSDPTSDIVNVFTFNRAQNVPGELMRPGRIDKRYRVVAPNGPNRLMILKDHIDRFEFKIDDEKLLEELAMKHTQDWTGAELAHVLVKEEAINAVADASYTVNVARMIAMTKDFTPMARQKVFAEDIKAMDEACSQFTKIGNVPDSEVAATPFRSTSGSRARRETVSTEQE